MRSHEVIATLRRNEQNLRSRGVRHAALFGSVAREDHGPHSDIDILIEVEPETVRDLWMYVGVKTFIADLFPGPVDVVDRAALRSRLKAPTEDEAVYAF